MIGVRLCWWDTYSTECVRCMYSSLDFAALEFCDFLLSILAGFHAHLSTQTIVQHGQLVAATRELGNILLNQSYDQKLFWQHAANQSHRRCQQKTTPKLTVIKTFQHTWATMQIQGNLAFSALMGTHTQYTQLRRE